MPDNGAERGVRRARREVTAALIFLTLMLILLAAAAAITARDLHTSSQRAYVERAIPVKTSVQDLLLQMVNQETGVRGYLATHDQTALDPYREGRVRAAADLARLRRLAKTDSKLRRHLESIASRVGALQAFYSAQIALSRGDLRSEVARGKALFDEFRNAARAMTADADRLVADTAARERRRYHSLLATLAVIGLAAIIVAAALLFLLPRRLRAAERRRTQLLTEVESLNRTLERMVQTDPLFRAGGSPAEVAEAICIAAAGIFEATGAAVWTASDDAITMLRRVPGAATLPRGISIPFSEHPDFHDDLESGRARFIADVETEHPKLWNEYAKGSDSRSQLRLPLASAGSAAALIVISWRERVEAPSDATMAVASRFADQAGVALAEATRREAAREASQLHARFEQSLLPTIELSAQDVRVATVYRPGDARLRLGGDFYDCLELADGSIALLIGDVAGHGAPAAALGASLRSAWRTLVLGGAGLEEIPIGMQRVCERERADRTTFVTALPAIISRDRSQLHFVAAGHPLPLLLGGPEPEGRHGPPLGVTEEPGWAVQLWPLRRASTVLLYTDGLVEGRAAPDTSERLGVEPIREHLATLTPGRISTADLRGMIRAATQANGAGLPDDVALLAMNLR